MGKCRMPLDMYDLKPEGMVSYLRYNGYHFSKKMCEWAVSLMYKYDPSSKRDVSVSFWDKEKVDSLVAWSGNRGKEQDRLRPCICGEYGEGRLLQVFHQG